MRRLHGFLALTLLACSPSIDTSLEAKECSHLGQCLPGYECSEDNLCVRRALTSPQTDGEDAGVPEGPEVDPGVITGRDPTTCTLENLCDGVCVDRQRDPAHCGACGRSCPTTEHGSASCREGTCELQCDEADGYTQCTDGCYRLDDDPLHCGDCALSCPVPANGAAVCAARQCSVRCDEGFRLCGGQCVRIEVDPSNCGDCGIACAPDQRCAGGGCVRACPENTEECARSCVDVRTDPQHCGRCDAPCTAPMNATAMCQAGSCSWQCGAGFSPCNAACVDLQNDVANCGACGLACAVAPPHGRSACTLGLCAVRCDDGYEDCEGLCVNSELRRSVAGLGCTALAALQDRDLCEGMGQGSTFCGGSCVNLANDPAHCGRCDRTCSSGQRCLLGNCIGLGF